MGERPAVPRVFRHIVNAPVFKPALPHRTRRGKWTKVRRIYLMSNPICEGCRGRPADVVHHIVPCVVDPSRMFDFDNLRALCHECHQQAHRRR